MKSQTLSEQPLEQSLPKTGRFVSSFLLLVAVSLQLVGSPQAYAAAEDGDATTMAGAGSLPTSSRVPVSSIPRLGTAQWSDALTPNGRPITEPAAGRVSTPRRDTEFQQFAARSTGHLLPIYGSALFDQAPSTFAPVDKVPVPADYVVGPGDQIELRIWGQIDAEQRLTVDRQGNVFVPQVGRINVAGLTFAQLEGTFRSHISHVFRNFEMSVDMGDLRSIQIFVMGHARQPGTYTVSALSTLVNALFVSGGPSDEGSMRDIQVRRAGRVVTTFDLYDLLLHGDKTKDVALKAGDVIFIAPTGPRVAVAGSVETPAIFEITPADDLQMLLNYAGGLNPVAAGQDAVLERIDERSVLESRNVHLDEAGLRTHVQQGDILEILQVVPRFEKTVSLKGNVADPVRLPWHAGMRVSDVIPEKRALLTRNYWQERNRLGADAASYQDVVQGGTQDRSLSGTIAGNKKNVVREFSTHNDVQPAAPDINWAYAAVERQDPQTLSTKLIPFVLSKAVIDHDQAEDLTLEPGDVITIFSSADFLTPQAEQTKVVRLEGEVKMAGLYTVQPGETLRDLLNRAGGLTDKAYVYGSTFSRTSTRLEQQARLAEYVDSQEHEIDQNMTQSSVQAMTADQDMALKNALLVQRAGLEKLRGTQASGRIVLAMNPESRGVEAFPPIPLENGDRLVVPSAPITVNVLGTVYSQASFLQAEAPDVRSCLQKAGGVTRYGDEHRMFLIRANGAVVSRMSDSKFAALEMYPGDTVVVPPKPPKVSKVRSMLDSSQLASSLGIGAIAAMK